MTAYRWVNDSRHLPRTGISSGTLRSVIEYGLPFSCDNYNFEVLKLQFVALSSPIATVLPSVRLIRVTTAKTVPIPAVLPRYPR